MKKPSEILESRLNEKSLLEKRANVSYFRSIGNAFLQYIRRDSSFVFCHNIGGLLEELGISIYSSTEWRCGACHMAYILTIYIFQPSLNNNTIFILSSYFIKHTLASFF